MSKPFECRNDCTRRAQLWTDTGVEYQRQIDEMGEVQVTNLSGAGGIFTVMAINKAYENVLNGDAGLNPSSYEYGFMAGQPRCKTTPESQEGCPLPEPESDRYSEATVEIARQTIQTITAPRT